MYYVVFITLAMIAIVVFMAIELGKNKERTKQAVQTAKDKDEDAQIASEPFISNPLDGMRPKD